MLQILRKIHFVKSSTYRKGRVIQELCDIHMDTIGFTTEGLGGMESILVVDATTDLKPPKVSFLVKELL